MKRSILLFTCTLVMILSCTKKKVEVGQVAIVPLPDEQMIGGGHFEINANTTVSVENEAQVKIAQLFFSEFEAVSGWKPVVKSESGGNITFTTDTSLEEEAYSLDVSPGAIAIKAASGAGFFYALQSLKQLLPPSFHSSELQANTVWAIPSVTIKDAPALSWRGYMLDVSRHFFDKEQIKEVIDFMAELKLNRFHWHLTDDQGWRVEIKSYPKLTEVGAWRMDYNTSDESVARWWGRPKQKPGEKPTYGGFYTQKDIKEIVAYAKERYIEIIPEIDMPGHAQATIAAYPEIGCVNAAPYVATGGVVKNNTYNPGKEETFVFAEKMLNEIMDLFPFQYVHIGGDECNKSQWRVDPHAQRRIKEEGLKDENELQSYFIKRIEKIINARGRSMIGWDEILEGGLAPNATVMSWRGERGGVASVKAGHEVIMSPNSYCYLDLRQGHDDLEPNLGYGKLLLSASYNYKVVPDALTREEGKLIKGIQGNLWSESISDWSKLTYMTFPRLHALAEVGWTSYEKRDWDSFADRLQIQFKKMDAQGVRYAVSAFSPWIDHKGDGEKIEITLKTEVNNLDIHYTLDGSEPDTTSTRYNGPFIITESAILNARAFKNESPVGYRAILDFPVHKAAGAKTIDNKTGKEIPQLTDLNYARHSVDDSNWNTFRGGVDIDIQLDEPTEVKNLKFNTHLVSDRGIYLPQSLEVYGAVNGSEFTKIGELVQPEKGLEQGYIKFSNNIDLTPATVDKLKIKAKSVSPVPDDHHTPRITSAMSIDEFVVN